MFRLILLRLLESYFRHRWLYILPTVIMFIAGGVYLFVREPQYVAKGIVFVQQESFIAQLTSVRDVSISWNSPAQQVATAINDLIQTDAFVRAIIQKTNLESKMDEGTEVVTETLDEVRSSVWAKAQGQNLVIIEASYDDPQIVSQLVDATTNNFIEWKINSDRVESETALNFFQDLSGTYKAEFDAAREELVNYLIAHPDPLRGDRPDQEQLEIDQLQANLQTTKNRYSRTLDDVESSRLALSQTESNANQTYIIIDTPIVPDRPEESRKQLAIDLAIFMAVGILLSIGGIGGSTLLNRSFMFPIDVINLTGLHVLASVPVETTKGLSKRGKNKNTSKVKPLSAQPSLITPSHNGNDEQGSLEKQSL